MTDLSETDGVGRGRETRTAKTKLAEVVVVCGKCARRQGLSPRALCKMLRAAAKRAAGEPAEGRTAEGAAKRDRRKLCVVESGCLGPCPKRALAVATGASLARGRIALIDPAAGPGEALAAVLGAGALPPAAPGPRRDPPIPDFGPNAGLGRRSPSGR